jgi:hypothetical protein
MHRLIVFVRSVKISAWMIIIFWEMTPCGSYKNRRFGGSYCLVEYSTSRCLYKSLQLRSVTCSHSCTLKMEAIRSSETSVLIRATRCHLPEDDNHHSHRRGNLKSYISAWSLSVLATFIVLSQKINANIYTQLNTYNINEKAENPNAISEMY